MNFHVTITNILKRPNNNVLPSSKILAFTSSMKSYTSLRNVSTIKNTSQIRILLLGSPGSGKGTQSSKTKKNFNITTISSGDILRQNIAHGTKIGKIAGKEIERGAYVSDDIMIGLITNELSTLKNENWLLDGFPRTINQAIALDNELKLNNQPLDAVINLHVPEEVILQRIIDRWVHIPSGRVYNLSYNPPKIPGLDDVTCERLSKRSDDNPETFKIRLQKYYELTEPLLEYYSKRNLLTTFSGHSSDEIYPKIKYELINRFGIGVKENFINNEFRDEILSI